MPQKYIFNFLHEWLSLKEISQDAKWRRNEKIQEQYFVN